MGIQRGIPTGFSVGVGWVWRLLSSPNDIPVDPTRCMCAVGCWPILVAARQTNNLHWLDVIGWKREAMWWRRALPALVVVIVAVSLTVVTAQQLTIGGRHRQRVVSGTARRETYRTSYTRETAARARQDELVPELIKISIEQEEETRKYTRGFSSRRNLRLAYLFRLVSYSI